MRVFRPVPLQHFVHRTLTLRLALMAVLISLLTGTAAYVAERRSLENMVAEETRTEILLLVTRTAAILRESELDQQAAFRRALDERIAVALGRESGSYVFVRFYQPAREVFEERSDVHYDLVEAVRQFMAGRPLLEPNGAGLTDLVTVGGRMHVHVVVPVMDDRTQGGGYAEAIFAPSETFRSTTQQKLRRTVVLTVLIVLATSGLLYPVILSLVSKLTLFSRNLLDANLETLSLLASAIAKRDSDTDVHNFRVTLYAVRLAEAIGLSASEIQSLIKGAFLHDVGKIGIRDKILLKPGGLDEEEVGQMREHVRHGMEIICDSSWLSDAALVVASHHERFDGSGYPQGLAGEAIPLLARIFAVVDVFDALTSHRPYKEPLSYEATMAVLAQGRGGHFDPAVSDTFARIAPELYRIYAGRDDQGLRQELKALVARSFSEGKVVLY